MEQTIKNVINSDISLISSGDSVGKELLKYLKNNNLLNANKSKGTTKFYITDLPQRFDDIGSQFLGRKLNLVEHISII